MGGDSGNVGRVEICLNSEWGTICSHGWVIKNAEVVCSQLGFQHVLSYFVRYQHVENVKIWMEHVDCHSGHQMLSDCEHGTDYLDPDGTYGHVLWSHCGSIGAVGVQCAGGKLLYNDKHRTSLRSNNLK